MGLLNEIIGVVVAEEALGKVDPGAGLFKEGMAAVAAFEGEKFVENKIEQNPQDTPDAQNPNT